MSGGNFTFRVEDELQDAFRAACKASDVSASQVLRAAMREFVAVNAQAALPLGPAKVKRARPARKGGGDAKG